jgi:hypothetical protein
MCTASTDVMSVKYEVCINCGVVGLYLQKYVLCSTVSCDAVCTDTVWCIFSSAASFLVEQCVLFPVEPCGLSVFGAVCPVDQCVL